MINIKWGTKYAVYPFEFLEKYSGEIVVFDKGITHVKLFEKLDSGELVQLEDVTFKNFQKAMIYANSELLKKYSENDK